MPRRPRTSTTPLPPRHRSFRGRALVLLLAALPLLFFVPSTASAQEVRLPGLQGGQLSDADLSQGATVLVVWASWSPKCRDIVQRVNAIERRWSGRARVVTVNFQEDRSTVEDFLAGKGLRVPVFLDVDGAFSKKNAVTNLPGLLVIKDGESAFRGKLPDDPDSILGEILG